MDINELVQRLATAETENAILEVLLSSGYAPSLDLVDLLCSLATRLQSQGDFARAFPLARAATALSMHLDAPEALARSSSMAAISLAELKQIADALIWSERALQAAEKSGNDSSIAECCANMAKTLFLSGDYPKALSLVERSIHLLEKLGRTAELGFQYVDLGRIQYLLGKEDSAFACFD